MNDKEISVLREEIEGLKRDAAMMMEAAEGVSLDPRHINKLEALDKALSQTPNSAAWLEKKIEERVGPLRDHERMASEFYKAWWEHPMAFYDGTMKRKLEECCKKVIKALSTEDSKEKKS